MQGSIISSPLFSLFSLISSINSELRGTDKWQLNFGLSNIDHERQRKRDNYDYVEPYWNSPVFSEFLKDPWSEFRLLTVP